MTKPPQTADAGLLSRIERWAPEDAEVSDNETA